MELNLYIYSGLGNIIALVDLLREDLSLSPEEVVKIAELEGVEFDQLISILPPESPDVDLSVEIYNADGSIAKNCINGARCLTKFVVDEELIIKNELSVTTLGGLWSLKTHQDGEYSVKFTNPNNLEIKNNLPPETTNHKHIISVEGNEIEIGVIDLAPTRNRPTSLRFAGPWTTPARPIPPPPSASPSNRSRPPWRKNPVSFVTGRRLPSAWRRIYTCTCRVFRPTRARRATAWWCR